MAEHFEQPHEDQNYEFIAIEEVEVLIAADIAEAINDVSPPYPAPKVAPNGEAAAMNAWNNANRDSIIIEDKERMATLRSALRRFDDDSDESSSGRLSPNVEEAVIANSPTLVAAAAAAGPAAENIVADVSNDTARIAQDENPDAPVGLADIRANPEVDVVHDDTHIEQPYSGHDENYEDYDENDCGCDDIVNCESCRYEYLQKESHRIFLQEVW